MKHVGMNSLKLIHSAHPQVGIIIFVHVYPSPLFKISQKTKRRMKIMIPTGGTVVLAERIIDDTCLVSIFFFLRFVGG